MSSEEIIRVFFALLFGAALAWGIYRRDDDRMRDDDISPQRLYSPIIWPWLLPYFIALLFLVLIISQNAKFAASMMFAEFFGVFLHIVAYYAVLLLLLPLLRRYVNARAAAVLWLLPNYLYITLQGFMKLNKPAFVLRLPVGERALKILFIVWLLGFAGVLAVSFVRHILFRHYLIGGFGKVTSPSLLGPWEREQKRMGMKKPKIPLVVSDNATSPLTIGLVRTSMRVVLPRREYTEEELALIFRHELIHILRSDIATKFFLRFCTAVCWFNPLMWIAMRKCADDLELGCDELVLANADESERRKYAALILSTASDERGFTTCLSANAEALKYRLDSILRPKRKLVGGILAGVLFFLLIATSGYVALAYGGDRAEDVIFGGDAASVTPDFESVTVMEGSAWKSYTCTDIDAVTDYIADLKICRMTGNFSFSSDLSLLVMYRNDKGLFGVELGESVIRVSYLYAKTSEQYYLSEPADLDYVMSFFEPYTEPTVLLPELYLNFGGWDSGDHHDFMWAGRRFVAESVNGEAVEPRSWDAGQASVIEGFPVEAVELIFPMIPEKYSVLVKSADGSREYTVDGESLDTYMLPLAPYSANYKVYASFYNVQDEDEYEYEMEFFFNVILPESDGESD